MKKESKHGGKVFGVLLTEQALGDLELALGPYFRTGPIGKYIYCRKVDPNGNYFVMLASRTNPDGTAFEAEISIPHQYIKLLIAASEESEIGFGADV